MLELQCNVVGTDKIVAESVESGNLVLTAYTFEGPVSSVQTNNDDVRNFALGLLELVGYNPPTKSTCSSTSRIEALEKAREHVAALATNSRGYTDGSSFTEREAAVRRVAAFILGESE